LEGDISSMKNKKKIFLIVALIASMTSAAQVSGYLGRRFSIGYATCVSPAFFSPDARSHLNDDNTHLNSVHELTVDYVLSSSASFCFSPQYLRTGVLFRHEPGERGLLYEPADDRVIRLSSINLAAGFKFFRRNAIAPLGKYAKFEMIVFFGRLSFDPDGFYNTPDPHFSGGKPSPYEVDISHYNFNAFAIACTLGRQHIFFDKLVLDTGLRFGLVPSVMDTKSGSPWEYEMVHQANMRLVRSELINFHIGIGFLAF
jgi:hypothetical protein